MSKCNEVYAHKIRVRIDVDKMLAVPRTFGDACQAAFSLASAEPNGCHMVVGWLLCLVMSNAQMY
jgi:hypothetical protein